MPSTTIEVRGIPIQFPVEPYGCQVEYMGSVIDALNNNSNALLESPTGTGKTLSLLCSVMGWARYQEQQFGTTSKVYYTSRTHTQLKQVMREFRKTEYGKIRIGETDEDAGTIDDSTLLGSRDQLCIHPRAIGVTSSTRNTLCKSIRDNKECRYHEKLDSFMQKGGLESCYDENGDDPKGRKEGRTLALDIEDLAAAGRAHNFCPFYYARKKAQTSKLTFMPYNYIVEPTVRKSLDIKLEEAIIIIDEAHNIADNIADHASIQVNTIQMANAVSELERAATAASKNTELTPQEAGQCCTEFDAVSQKIIRLISWVEHLTKKSGFETTETPLSQPGKVIRTVLSDMGLDKASAPLRKALSELTKESEGKGAKTDRPGLSGFLDFLEGAYRYNEEELDEYFICVLYEESNRNLENRYAKNNIAAPSVLGLWCMDAGVAMRRVVQGKNGLPGPRSVLITSGTMSPMEHFAAELGIPFPVQLQSTHVITQSQLLPLAVTSYNSVRLQSSYTNRKTNSYLSALGRALCDIFTTVPDGVLVFFQSFAFMKEVITAWKRPQSYDHGHTVFDVLLSRKYIFEEGKSSEAQAQLREYRSMLDEGSGASLFAVFRGKMAEGMDFPDRYARAVCLCGVPYAALGDSRIKLKREYLDRKHSNRTATSLPTISGSAWYQLNAVRALNQAVGRVIRHAGDYGAVFFLDDRYDNQNLRSQLPSWVGGHLKATDSLPNSTDLIRSFFNMNALNASGRRVVAGSDDKPAHTIVGPSITKTPSHNDAAEQIAFSNARRYDEALSRDPEVKRRRSANIRQNWGTVPTASATADDFKGLAGGGDSPPSNTPTPSAVKKGLGSKVGSAASNEVIRYQIPEYKEAVTKMFTPEEVNIWKNLLKEFCEIVKSRGEVTEFLRTRFVPWCCDNMQRAGASHSFIRSQVIFLPLSTKEPYLKAVTSYIGRIRKRKTDAKEQT